MDHELSIKLDKNNLLVNGKGNILFQEQKDILEYSIDKKKDNLDFKTILKIKNNILKINFLNYEKDKKNEAIIQLTGSKNKKDETLIRSFSINESKNKKGSKVEHKYPFV